MENNKTDLAKILSVSGKSGLYEYLAQARNGVIARHISTGERTCLDARSKITSLADISIYTDEGELKLLQVLEKLHEVLSDSDAPEGKENDKALVELFTKAVPDYDGTRFHVSHMRKIADWYNVLRKGASLDFVKEEDAAEEKPEA